MRPHSQELNLTLKSLFFFAGVGTIPTIECNAPRGEEKTRAAKCAGQRGSELGRAEGPKDGGAGSCGNGEQISKPETDGRQESVIHLLGWRSR